jgi:hypothetical protein
MASQRSIGRSDVLHLPEDARWNAEQQAVEPPFNRLPPPKEA